MNPIVTLAAGIVLGALGIRYGQKRGSLRAIRQSGETGTALIRGGLDRAGNQLRGAAVSGLAVVEKQSGQLRQRLEGGPEEPVPEPPKKVSRAKRSPRKTPAATAAKGKADS